LKTVEEIIKGISFEKIRGSREILEEFQKQKYVLEFLSNINSLATKRNYSIHLIKFCNNVHLTPSDLITLASQEDRKSLSFPMTNIVNSWRDKAKENHVSTGIRRNTLTALESFFKWNNVPIGEIKKPTYSPERIRKEPSIENLKRFRDSLGNLRNIALFDFLCCVPVRDGQFQECDCGDCKKDWSPKWEDIQTFPKIDPFSNVIIPCKKGHTNESYKGAKHISFLTESASNSLNLYREYREKTEKRAMRANESIFVEWREREEEGERKPISQAEVLRIFKQASINSGFSLNPHEMRNFVKSMLERHNVPSAWSNMVIGHKVSNLEEAYSTHSIETMFEGTQESTGLKTALAYLDIGNGNTRRSFAQGEQLAILQKKVEALEKENEALKNTQEEMKIREETLKGLAEKKGSLDSDTIDAVLKVIKLLDSPEMQKEVRIALLKELDKRELDKHEEGKNIEDSKKERS
jgi:hypothetical protein